MKRFTTILFVLMFISLVVEAQWTVQSSGTTETLNAVDFHSENYGFAVGNNGVAVRTIDGENWTGGASSSNTFFNDVSVVNDSTVLIVGHKSYLFISEDRGGDPTIKHGDSTRIIIDIGSRKNEEYFFINGTNRVFYNDPDLYTVKSSEVIELPPITDPEFRLHEISVTENTIFASAYSDFVTVDLAGAYLLYKSEDDGINWERMNSFPMGNDDYSAYYKIDFVNSNTGYMAGTNSQTLTSAEVSKTTDGGESFTTVFSDSGYDQVTDIFFLNENYGWIILDYQTVLRTADGGNSWSDATSGIVSAIDDIVFVNENVGYAVGAQGAIYKTTNGGGSVTSVNDDTQLPKKLTLEQNYPNPFNPSTTISYSVPKQNNVSLKVYDVLGKEIAELVNTEKSAGSYEVDFNADNLSSGIYFYTLKTNNSLLTKKMMLIK